MCTHPTHSRQKVTPRIFGVVRTSEGNGREREKERVERKVKVGGASVALLVILQNETGASSQAVSLQASWLYRR